MPRWLILSGTHAATLLVGFMLGIYLLPILTAPDGPDDAELAQSSQSALFEASFTRDLKGSDFLHWGEGTVSVTPTQVVHEGALAPGPDYKLYLAKEFVEDEEGFFRIKAAAQQIGDIKTFDGFIVDVPAGVDVADYSTVIVWCESFSEFITAARYQ
ncbi:DM13 domain-containing protein [Pyruvatibacter mobilis]|uniref:DM13 domain-containing protein n=1 Tax=Pyruvatibacter mobilis TaxID=1712261 RepID=UPI003C7C468B